MSVVTGEAVTLDLRVARLGSRAIAYLLDLCVVGVLIVIWTFVWAQVVADYSSRNNDVALAVATLLVLVVGTLVGYPVVLETTTRGRTLGKMAMGLRVVREDGGPVSFRQAFARGLVGLFELYAFTGIPAVVSSLASGKGKRVGDYLAGTVVLQERVPSRAGAIAFMPPPLAGWAAGADISGVNDALALAVRQFLGRAHDLNPPARAEMEQRLATAVAAAVAPPPPPGTPGWALLSAVAAERRRREELRLLPRANVGERPSAPAPPPAPRPTPPAAPRDDGGFTLPS